MKARGRGVLVMLVALATATGLALVPTGAAQGDDPECVGGLTATVQEDGTIMLEWEAVEGTQIYHIHRTEGDEDPRQPQLHYSETLDESETSFVDEGVEEGTTYSYAVAAHNHPDGDCEVVQATAGAAGEDDGGDEQPAEGEEPTPECVGNPMAEARDDGSIHLSWDAVDGAEVYHIHEVVDGEVGGLVTIVDATETEYLHEDLQAGTTYSYAIAAHWHPTEDCPVIEATAIPFFPGFVGLAAAVLGAAGVALVVSRRR